VNTLAQGWRPFLDPMPLHDHVLWLLIPTALLIAMTWKAVRMPALDGSHNPKAGAYPKQVIVMGVQIVLAMLLLHVAFIVLVRFVLPMVAPVPG
jgi:hypothetical protein